jgi:PAS domain S-box-containing protein
VTEIENALPLIDPSLLKESVEEVYQDAPCGYLSLLPDGRIARVNQTFTKWTGYQEQELVVGRRLSDLLTIGGRVYYETHFAPLLRMQGFVNEVAFDLARKDGSVLPVILNAAYKRDTAGQPVFILVTLFDATDRRRYERELLLARRSAEMQAKEKADLLAMISHDIRTPLSSIANIAHLLERTPLSDNQRRYVRMLRSSYENMAGLVNNLLDLSKIEAGKATFETQPFDIRELANDIAQSMAGVAEGKGVTVAVEADQDTPTKLIGDRTRLGQIISNLLGNAVKFTEKGTVTLRIRTESLTSDQATLNIEVVDTGIGIPNDRLTAIFDDYTQGSYDTSAKYGGSGLGLAISRKLLQLFGSKMTVRSTPGEGSTFSFVLTLKRPFGPAGGI